MATWHAGEAALQQRVGMADRMAEVGPRVIRDHLPEQHRGFFPLLPFLVVGTVDRDGQPRASVLANPAGFVTSPDPAHLAVAAVPLPGDPIVLRRDQPVGLLGLEPHTRRRNRMNGRVETVGADGFTVRVVQSFGNCPKYIVPRRALHKAPRGAPAVVGAAGLDARARDLVDRADMLFIATAHPQAGPSHDPAHGVDVSHRGGPAGFLARGDGDTLELPDYPGNQFFNTLGNLALDPRAGLLVLDPDTGDVLQLAVRALTAPEPGRSVRFEVTAMVRIEHTLPIAWA